ncbi:uncharacterized protein RJT20DRAFT_26384 [Scheffersomyces xylosifermentans]|uniref:uncharacterized protein n=1 Tax=Scheffersomyces xylosifermentans TaxID=1304137 RepID=UPI00315C6B36
MSRRSGRSRYSEPTESIDYPEEDETNNYEAEGEDEIEDDEQEVTRCICEQDELNPSTVNQQLSDVLHKEYSIKIDQGLFIQCDKCSVWQHGYCVGLFTNDEVPDKYWCELCKPDLHVFIYESNEVVRSLYKPVNDKRKKLSLESLAAGQSMQPKPSRQRSKRSSSANSSINESQSSSNGNNKNGRKERRHLDESYDEQLQKALRESAKESGVKVDSEAAAAKKAAASHDNSGNNSSTSATTSTRRRNKSDSSDESQAKKTKIEVTAPVESDNGEQEASTIEEDNDEESKSKYETRRTKARGRGVKAKKKASASTGSTSTNKTENDGPTQGATKEELINQPSKPRYVSEKSSIYELRKRTGAILEWLGRSQLELEDEKSNKIELFSFKEKIDVEQQVIDEEGNKVIVAFDENLRLMEKLTESILTWEQKFGKYAP